jgi:virginiamycin B lyase
VGARYPRAVRGVAPKIVVASLVALLLAGSAAAAPPLRARIRAPAAATVGEEWRAHVTVTRGSHAVPGLRVSLRARQGGATRSARARAGARGRYVARLRFPSAGRWSYAVVVAGRTLARGSVTVRIRPTPIGTPTPPAADPRYREWSVATSQGQVHPHDIWPAGDGTVWYTGQLKGTLGRLNTATGAFHEIRLGYGAGSGPHGVISGPDGDAWVTVMNANAIARVDAVTETVTPYPIPTVDNTAPHTGAWDNDGILWFTGIAGYVGRLDPATGDVDAWPAPRGAGPYGIDATPSGDVYFVSLQPASYLGKVDKATGAVRVIDPPRPGIQFRRVWSDSDGRLWASEWEGGRLARYDPTTGTWAEWPMPGGAASQGYAIYVDAADIVWITDFGTDSLVRFDPVTQQFQSFRFPTPGAAVRQIVGDENGIWGAESATEKIVLFRSTS